MQMLHQSTCQNLLLMHPLSHASGNTRSMQKERRMLALLWAHGSTNTNGLNTLKNTMLFCFACMHFAPPAYGNAEEAFNTSASGDGKRHMARTVPLKSIWSHSATNCPVLHGLTIDAIKLWRPTLLEYKCGLSEESAWKSSLHKNTGWNNDSSNGGHCPERTQRRWRWT